MVGFRILLAERYVRVENSKQSESFPPLALCTAGPCRPVLGPVARTVWFVQADREVSEAGRRKLHAMSCVKNARGIHTCPYIYIVRRASHNTPCYIYIVKYGCRGPISESCLSQAFPRVRLFETEQIVGSTSRSCRYAYARWEETLPITTEAYLSCIRI